ncbi:hypothetical protein LT702_24115 [Pseudomonas syringae pv. syringae]|uniref:hypothetical protein n=1 Tax=Pseudomonas syringae TaxID=317 RepID=UPI00200AB922|nr:hypothetical protein [Pseudomonas syringae]MCK9754673.1 hypothetical protein [Pseudomonas syringae pv. syringae]
MEQFNAQLYRLHINCSNPGIAPLRSLLCTVKNTDVSGKRQKTTKPHFAISVFHLMRLVFHRCFLRIFIILGDTWQLRLSHARGMLLLHPGGFDAYNDDKGKHIHLKETHGRQSMLDQGYETIPGRGATPWI